MLLAHAGQAVAAASLRRLADPVLALRIAVPLWWFWWTNGLTLEAREWLRRGMAQAEETGDDLQHAAALSSLGLALPGARPAARGRRVPHRRPPPVRRPCRAARCGRLAERPGHARSPDRDRPRSRALALAGLSIAREIGSVVDQLDMINRLGLAELDSGAPDAALRLFAVSARERDRLGSPLLMPDEIAEMSQAWTSAVASLGLRADEVLDWAADLPLKAVVDGLLEG